MRPAVRRAVAALLVAVIVAVGAAIALLLVRTRPRPAREPPEDPRPLVEVVPVARELHRRVVEAQGTIRPAQEVTITPQVTGRIAWQSPRLVPGGKFGAGEPMVRIERNEYELAARQREADVAQRALDLELERGRRRVAERETELLDELAELGYGRTGTTAPVAGETSPLALRGPQVETARAQLDAAQSALDRARLDLARTEIRAPFAAIVVEEAVDPGQVVGPETRIATLVGTTEFWAQASLPVERLGDLRVPGVNAPPGSGSPARVIQETGRGRIVRNGRVARLLGRLDPGGRLARVLVAIDDPLGGAAEPPLLLDAYVRVEIDAGLVPGVAIPAAALRDGRTVYVAAPDGTLDVRPVEILSREPDRLVIGAGLAGGERVIVSRLPSPIPGQPLRVAGAGAP